MTKQKSCPNTVKSGVFICLLFQANPLYAQSSSLPQNISASTTRSKNLLPPLEQSESNKLSNQPGVWVNKIHLQGNTVFSDEQLEVITDSYENRKITTEELQQLRRELTLYYIKNGFISSGAVIPDQEVGNGEITLKIIEGKLSDIHIQDFQSLRIKPDFLTKRISVENKGPLNLNHLQQRLKLLHQNRQVQQLQTELTPGAFPGESILSVKATEPNRFQSGISVNNGRSPSVGEFRLEAWLTDNNFSRNGDMLSLQLGTTEGLNDAAIDYIIPVSARDASLSFSASRSESEIIEEPFDQINITSNTNSASIKYEHPIAQSINGYFNLSLSFEKRTSKSFLDGIPEDFLPRANVTVIRFGQAWLKKTKNRVLAINSRFSFGLNALGATKSSGDDPDGEFMNFFGQLQWVQRLKLFNLVLRAETQRSNDPLLSLEKFGLGGSRSVRGYRENLFVRDEGWLGSIEARIPIHSDKLKLALFFEGGRAENIGETSAAETIASSGIGIRWQPTSNLQAQGYWGAALKDVELGAKNNLQDDGLHFSVDYKF